MHGTRRSAGLLADALTCNPVVKSFGAEEREDQSCARVVGKWRKRVRRTWMRFTTTSTIQLLVLLGVRASVVGGALLLWIAGKATPGDVTYVLTSYFVIHGYSARRRHARQQPAAFGERHGGAGGDP